MKMALLVALSCVVVLLLVLLVVLLANTLSGRRRMRQALADSRVDVEALRTQLEAMSNEIESARIVAAAAPAVPQTEYLITSVGGSHLFENEAAVSNRAVLSVAFGEPLVKVVAFGYGVRRALSPETRNRIAFEMRREVKRARKERRRDTKRAGRQASRSERREDAA